MKGRCISGRPGVKPSAEDGMAVKDIVGHVKQAAVNQETSVKTTAGQLSSSGNAGLRPIGAGPPQRRAA